MIRFKTPSEDDLRRFLERQRSQAYSYPGVGLSQHLQAPPGYRSLHHRIQLGTGERAFESAKAAVKEWKMFGIPWVRVFPSSDSVREGQDVAVLATIGGVTFVNACRIVYLLDSDDRFGFAYGTLSEHVGRGEERFCVERVPADGSVWYDLYSFSRTSRLFYRAVSPYFRRFQKRFALHSLQAMQKVVSGD